MDTSHSGYKSLRETRGKAPVLITVPCGTESLFWHLMIHFICHRIDHITLSYCVMTHYIISSAVLYDMYRVKKKKNPTYAKITEEYVIF